MKTKSFNQNVDFTQLATDIKRWGQDLGFQQVGISDTDLTTADNYLQKWLAQGFQGDMKYMAAHGTKRSQPDQLVPGTLRIISARYDYLPPDTDMIDNLGNPKQAYVSRYAVGRDYHKIIRKKLQQLAKKISDHAGNFGYRAFVDSAPVLEKAIAEKAGLGWIAKNTLVTNTKAGSWFFLGEVYTDLPLPIDQPASNHCGSCTACLDLCPTKAFIGPYQLDARRCISYLTIENKGSIPEELRPLMGNRIFGCDDCQLVCPWNKFAKNTVEKDFFPRHNLTTATLVELFSWNEAEFLQKTEGSAIRRAGYEGWLRNIAVAMGNAPFDPQIVLALKNRQNHPSPLVREHTQWALEMQKNKHF